MLKHNQGKAYIEKEKAKWGVGLIIILKSAVGNNLSESYEPLSIGVVIRAHEFSVVEVESFRREGAGLGGWR